MQFELGQTNNSRNSAARMSGFYHGEFECSSFAATKENRQNYREALWLGGASTFANPKNIKRVNNTAITVDGTFELGPGGHLGLWMGEISRLTYCKAARGKPSRVAPSSAIRSWPDPVHEFGAEGTRLRHVESPVWEQRFADGNSH